METLVKVLTSLVSSVFLVLRDFSRFMTDFTTLNLLHRAFNPSIEGPSHDVLRPAGVFVERRPFLEPTREANIDAKERRQHFLHRRRPCIGGKKLIVSPLL
jgi:hypothetical protein